LLPPLLAWRVPRIVSQTEIASGPTILGARARWVRCSAAFGCRPGASGAPSRAAGIRNGNSGQNQVTTIDVHCFVRFFDPNLVFMVMLFLARSGHAQLTPTQNEA
jgi:hypothetical protein